MGALSGGLLRPAIIGGCTWLTGQASFPDVCLHGHSAFGGRLPDAFFFFRREPDADPLFCADKFLIIRFDCAISGRAAWFLLHQFIPFLFCLYNYSAKIKNCPSLRNVILHKFIRFALCNATNLQKCA